MEKFAFFAQPWWVNLCILIPVVLHFVWHKKRLDLTYKTLVAAACFAVGFGFVEASVVVYLRAASGMLTGGSGVLVLNALSSELARIEFFREIATMIMLISVALLATETKKECFAVFLWAFAIWDIIYYIGLWAVIGWPKSLLAQDVLFLIPVPWLAQVWFPLLVSALTLAVVLFSRKSSGEDFNKKMS